MKSYLFLVIYLWLYMEKPSVRLMGFTGLLIHLLHVVEVND